MRRLLFILLTILLITFVMGCSRGIDHRLVLADTLMWTAPDSSLAILSAINRDSLQGDENQAYYALLLTQAQFRCIGNCSSDSLINSALDYYKDNHNREHYTRALVYKGAYYEFNTNEPVKAIKYYKQAENNASTDDYRNLAQINMRLGVLYYKYYASNNLDLEKNKEALNYYEKLNDKRMILKSSLNTANSMRATDSENAEKYYKRAELLARELSDSTHLYLAYINHSVLCLKDSLMDEAKDYSLKAWNVAGGFKENCDYYILGDIYAKIGALDSANYFLSQPDVNENTDYDNVTRYKCMMDIELAKNNQAEYIRLNKLYEHMVDSLEHNKNKYIFLEEETKFDKSESLNNKTKISILKRWVTWVVALLCAVLVVFTILYLIKRHNTKKLIEELSQESISNYNSFREDIGQLDDDFSHLMQSQLNVFEEIMVSGYNPNNNPADYSVTHKIKAIDKSNVEFWNGLRSFLNHRYDGIIDRIIKDCPSLSDDEINFIGLVCCDFSNVAIAVCQGYRNSSSVRSRRRYIRDKMKINGLLDDYLKKMMENTLA